MPGILNEDDTFKYESKANVQIRARDPLTILQNNRNLLLQKRKTDSLRNVWQNINAVRMKSKNQGLVEEKVEEENVNPENSIE